MDHIPEEDWPTVGEESHAVVRQAKEAGVWIFGGGVMRQQASIVNTDGTVVDGPVTRMATGRSLMALAHPGLGKSYAPGSR